MKDLQVLSIIGFDGKESLRYALFRLVPRKVSFFFSFFIFRFGIIFLGNIPDGLHCHPDGVHIIYPIGNSVSIQNTKTKKQEFLNGHTNIISAVTLSNTGKYIASGQINHMG